MFACETFLPIEYARSITTETHGVYCANICSFVQGRENIFLSLEWFIQSDSCLVDITVAADILGVYDQRTYISMGPIPNGYVVMGVF
jgi:hypothetical protein